MTLQSAINHQEQLANLEHARKMLLSCSANNGDIKHDIDHISSSIDNIIVKINLLHSRKLHSQKIINAIQNMCSNIKSDHISSGIDDFHEILDMCDSEHQKLLVLYCCVIAYAIYCADTRKIESFSYFATYDDNLGNERSEHIKHFSERKFLSEKVFLMVEQVMSAYYSIYSMHDSDYTNFDQSSNQFFYRGGEPYIQYRPQPLFGLFGISLIPNFKINEYARFFIDFKKALLTSVPGSQTISFYIQRSGPILFPSNIMYGNSSYNTEEEKIIQTFLIQKS